MASGADESIESKSVEELCALVRSLIGEVERLRAENGEGRARIEALSRENLDLKAEIRRLKGLPPRPPAQSTGMEKASERTAQTAAGSPTPPRRRGPGASKLRIDETVTLRVEAPEGSRCRGYEDLIVQDIVFSARTTLYRRERRETPEGAIVTAPTPAGVIGGCGPHLHRLVLMLHFKGQMTCERITGLLNDAGVSISKRQVVRLLTAKLDVFAAEEAAAFETGLKTSPYITVDDTGARHAGKTAYTTQFGSARFTAFRTAAQKSRLAFLRHLLGGVARFEVNAEALAYAQAVGVAPSLQEALERSQRRSFADERAWSAHLDGFALPLKKGVMDSYRLASEAALWGAIRAQGRLEATVIVSDEAGQFRVGDHALCWVHAERLVQKLIPANALQENAIEVFKRMVWWFYGRLKAFKAAPSPQLASELSRSFDRIFLRRTRYQSLDALLKRLAARKAELLRVLQSPEIPLNTNASENDIRTVVIKRKISGGTVSEKGRSARDVMLGLAKTCAKLRLSFFDYLGDRIGIPAPHIPPLETLVGSVHP
jgi:hypothetical protein